MPWRSQLEKASGELGGKRKTADRPEAEDPKVLKCAHPKVLATDVELVILSSNNVHSPALTIMTVVGLILKKIEVG